MEGDLQGRPVGDLRIDEAAGMRRFLNLQKDLTFELDVFSHLKRTLDCLGHRQTNRYSGTRRH